MNLEVTGKVTKVLEEMSGQGRNGTWVKREFVIEIPSQYPRSVCFTSWGERAEVVKSLEEGEEVTVTFDPESREYNGRWYTDLKAWRIEKKGSEAGGEGREDGELTPVASNASYDVQPKEGGGEEEDLPF